MGRDGGVESGARTDGNADCRIGTTACRRVFAGRRCEARGAWAPTGDSSNCRIGTAARCPDVMVTRCESRMELAATMDRDLNRRIGAAAHYRERTRDEVRVQGMEPVARMGVVRTVSLANLHVVRVHA